MYEKQFQTFYDSLKLKICAIIENLHPSLLGEISIRLKISHTGRATENQKKWRSTLTQGEVKSPRAPDLSS